ncbi:hypothetical protein BH23CYA1_BH23CYA1_00930 [soil metagenome]
MSQPPKEILPVWFTERMMGDEWSFGLMTTTGVVICINSISSISQAADGSIWLDVDLMPDEVTPVSGMTMFCAPTSRTKASLNASHIIAAFELADT